MADTYDVWSPENIKRFQAAMGLKNDGIIGKKTSAALGTQKGANWLLGDYNRGLAVNSALPLIAPTQATVTTTAAPVLFNPYDEANKLTTAEFNAAGNEILSGEAGGSFGTGVTVPGATNGLAGSLSGMWDSIGGAKGFADLAGGLGVLGSLYTGYKQNKMAEQEHNARMGELARQRQRDADWEKGIKASGLGSYSAGMGGK